MNYCHLVNEKKEEEKKHCPFTTHPESVWFHEQITVGLDTETS